VPRARGGPDRRRRPADAPGTALPRSGGGEGREGPPGEAALPGLAESRDAGPGRQARARAAVSVEPEDAESHLCPRRGAVHRAPHPGALRGDAAAEARAGPRRAAPPHPRAQPAPRADHTGPGRVLDGALPEVEEGAAAEVSQARVEGRLGFPIRPRTSG